MEKKYVVSLKDAVTGVLHANTGTYRVLIDGDNSDAKHFSFLVNTMNAGVIGDEHKHEESEHCCYILSGTGTLYIEGEPYEIGPEMAVYTPADKMHRVEVGPDEDLTYVLIYAPPGPERELKEKGEHAFGAR